MSRARRRALPVSVYLDPERLAKLRAYAEAKGLGQGDVIRQALDEFLVRVGVDAGSGGVRPRVQVAALPAPKAASSDEVAARAELAWLAEQRRVNRPTHERVPSAKPWRPVGEVEPPATGAPPMAWDDQGDPIDPPRDAAAWRVLRKLSAGPQAKATPVERGGVALVLDLYAPYKWLQEALGGDEGAYWLDPVDAQGRVLRGPRALVVFTKRGGETESDFFRRRRG